jgi:hypothetical protein
VFYLIDFHRWVCHNCDSQTGERNKNFWLWVGSGGQGFDGKKNAFYSDMPYLRLFILWVLFGEGGTPRDSTLGPNKRNLGGKRIRILTYALDFYCNEFHIIRKWNRTQWVFSETIILLFWRWCHGKGSTRSTRKGS